MYVYDQTSGLNPALQNPDATGNTWVATSPLKLGDTYVWYLGVASKNNTINWGSGETFTLAQEPN